MSLLTGHSHTWSVGLYEPRRLYGCQLTLPAVCQLWRKIALDLTPLWTSVMIANDPPYDLLELFLSRCGISPLDISVYMDRPIEVYDDEDVAQTTADEIHEFLQRHCPPSRWRTFRLETNDMSAFFILSTWPFTKKSTFPALQSLDLVFTGSFPLKPRSRSISSLPLCHHLEFAEPQAKLRYLRIQGLLSPYIFGTSFHKQLNSLVHLELRFLGESERHLSGSSIPAARLLSEDPTSPDVVQALNTPKVHIPTLKTLSFLSVSSPVWVLNHLLTLDAPNLTTFELTFGHEFVKPKASDRKATKQLVSYIATSGPVGADKKLPLYPSLAHITFSSFEASFEENLDMLLAGYPTINSLVLPKCSTLRPLFNGASELVDLKVGIKEAMELRDFLVMRREAGMPLQTVRAMLGNPIEAGLLNELEGLVQFLIVDKLESGCSSGWPGGLE
ncbi:unnamed protein product [Rhizoctonia solani]|uniref:F-box domain-containing protein n=1 Tax=Rhizoctonia solani TaxID=456999 RepID=A0A8H3C2Y2_9AGAM|nr:unnamed protein product [Rhizoctonia solani]